MKGWSENLYHHNGKRSKRTLLLIWSQYSFSFAALSRTSNPCTSAFSDGVPLADARVHLRTDGSPSIAERVYLVIASLHSMILWLLTIAARFLAIILRSHSTAARNPFIINRRSSINAKILKSESWLKLPTFQSDYIGSQAMPPSAKRARRFPASFSNMRIFLSLAVFGGQSWLVNADQVIGIQGHYVKTLYNYNKPTGEFLRVAFSVSISKNACGIWATNMDDASIWETVIYDGTNTYLLAPFAGHFLEARAGAKLCGLVNPGRQYYMMGLSIVDSFIPWITYCLRPSDVTPDMPSPSVDWRINVNSYGWRWTNVMASLDGNFFQGYTIIRDSSLDLDNQSEFLRTNLEYPQTIDDFQNQGIYMDFRKEIPDGWVAGTYTCDQWYETNGFSIPMRGEFKHYTYSGGTTFLTSSRTIQTDRIAFSEGSTVSAPPIAEKAYVRDYRYTRRSENRMFPYAEYIGSDSWKSDSDPDLLAQVNRYMKYGPKFGDFGVVSKVFSPQGGRLIVIWSLLLLVNAVIIAILVRNKVKKGN